MVPADGDPIRLSAHVTPPQPRVSDVFSTVDNRFQVDLEVVGSTLGLFCLAYNCGTCVVIWNPATRDWYQVPDPEIPVTGFWRTSFGFAHDYASPSHYKVVRFVYGHDNSFHPWFNEDHYKVNAEVYDSRTDSWKEITNAPQVEFSAKRCGVIVKGVPYWPAYRSEYGCRAFNEIVSFNPGSDTFSTFNKPFGLETGENSVDSWRLGVVADSLVVLIQKRDRSVDVWMMGDIVHKCWVKQFSVGPVDRVVSWVKCWEDGEFLVSDYSYEYSDHCRELFLYDPWNNKTRMFPEFQSREESRSYEVYVYEETLLSPWPSRHEKF